MNDNILKTNSVVIVLVNDERYGGSTYWFIDPADASDVDYRAISYIPLNRDTQLPGGFTNIFFYMKSVDTLSENWERRMVCRAIVHN